ncbi:MAG: FAD-binding protein [Ilumatobacteraceae bacterium]|jgi:decaprenylphospho-beta-D-ribofuranose 2-oxidase|nr:FAD-binding oxidoreductase [Ilumatobacteraceae bacterium]MBP7888603.1 FAD-binding oxidoreductase [Ilumatobacteraceae bacterium]MBP9051487.1 FAD-binding oxidoreductase [Ilumatobacteraceae bacterium]
MPSRRRSLTGWGLTNGTVADVLELPNHEVASALKEAGSRGALVRGLGRSYGDAAQNAGGLVLRLLGAAHQAVLDPQRATVTVPAGVSMDDLLRVIVPRGFFVPVTPGTRFVTIGGAIASDIHGKNHHGEGSFGNHVESLTMLLADGSQVVVGPQQRPELFWATVGGMGLTGVILDATISLIPIETSRMSVDTTRIADLDTLLATMTEGDDDYRYSVAWIDPQAKGRSLGRSVLGRGDHARLDQLGPKEAIEPLAYDAKQLVTVPPLVPPMGFINHATVAAFNEMWYRKAPRHRVGELQGIATFFHPLDMVSRWNRIYGAHGMLQYQVVVPFGAEETMRTVIERFAASGTASFLAVLKRFGPGSLAPMSFPAPGWTLTLDVPAATGGLGDLLHSLDRLVLDAGGRHYFAKDSVTTPEAIRRGYPRLAEWKAIRDAVDPTGLWQSDLSRRLGLTD